MIEFQSVGFRYGGNSAANADLDVLRDVNFRLAQGSFRWVFGGSGSGKTTLLRLMSLMLAPSRGEIFLSDAPARTMDRQAVQRWRRDSGLVRSDCGLIRGLSVYDNVALPLRLQQRSEAQIRADVIEMLRWIGLARKTFAMPGDLSESERRRVAIARSVITRPRLLLADEPTMGLDDDESERALRLLFELQRLGSTVVIATKDVALVERYPAGILRLSEGGAVVETV